MSTGTASRRDDVESLYYSSLRSTVIQLPWLVSDDPNPSQIVEQAQVIYNVKENGSLLSYFEKFPSEFLLAYRYIRSLNFFDRPDYVQLKAMTQSALDSL